jgi:hypothetical protein
MPNSRMVACVGVREEVEPTLLHAGLVLRQCHENAPKYGKAAFTPETPGRTAAQIAAGARQ